MEVIVDEKSGFCFGVKKAIGLAEKALTENDTLYCLGDIVHNEEEVARLSQKGLKVINHDIYYTLSNCTILIRAHGEPPKTYQYAREKNITLIEGTCPVVLKIQQKVRQANEEAGDEGQIVIFGKENHAEVIGLAGQTNNRAIILKEDSEIQQLDYSRPIRLFAQTTMGKEAYRNLKNSIEKHALAANTDFKSSDSICGQVSNRGNWLKEFSTKVEAVIFVGGKKSSNSKILFQICKNQNRNSFFVNSEDDLPSIELANFKKIGVCGATSTPQWLMEDVAQNIREYYK